MVSDTTTFTVKCTMRTRWVPNFLGMLKKMEQYGGMGCSGNITFYADGDGDFRPKFETTVGLPEPANPIKDDDGDLVFDAG